MNASTKLACGVLLAAMLSPQPAAAASTPTTTVSAIKVVAKDTPQYELQHGVLWLAHDKARFTYRWGGAYCGTSLSEMKVSMLFAAMRSKHNVDIDFSIRTHKGKRYRCITGFTIRRG